MCKAKQQMLCEMRFENMCEIPHNCTVHYIDHLTPKVLLLLWFSTQGTALVFAPLRGETLRLFCQLAQQTGFDVSQHQQYDAQVMDVHLKVGNMPKTLRQ